MLLHRTWAFLGTLVLWGCLGCTTPRTSKTEKLKSGLKHKEKKQVDEYRAEIEIGRNMGGRLLAYYGVHDDETLVGYVNQVGTYVASYSDHPERRYMFQILDSDSVNAFACPGGYILLTRGAVRHAQNEAELAHVIGHEIAHVGEKHMFDALQGMSKDEMDKAAKEADKAGLKFSPELKARKRPVVKEDETGAMLAKYISGSAAGLSILSAAKAGMSLILEKGLGAEKEYEADSLGAQYAVRAGYHPRALMNYLCRIEQKKKGASNKPCVLPKKKKKKGKKKVTILDKTHPAVADRIANIKKSLLASASLNTPGARGRKRFQSYRKRIPVPAE